MKLWQLFWQQQVPKPLELSNTVPIYGEMSIDYKKEVVQLRKEELEVIAEAFILSNGKSESTTSYFQNGR